MGKLKLREVRHTAAQWQTPVQAFKVQPPRWCAMAHCCVATGPPSCAGSQVRAGAAGFPH